TAATTVTAASPRASGLAQPSVPPCRTSTCSAIIASMKVSTPPTSKRYGPLLSALLSGVPRIIHRPSNDTATDRKKIQRQPKDCATRPPNSAARPPPPQDPIDHRLTARCRAAPSQY